MPKRVCLEGPALAQAFGARLPPGLANSLRLGNCISALALAPVLDQDLSVHPLPSPQQGQRPIEGTADNALGLPLDAAGGDLLDNPLDGGLRWLLAAEGINAKPTPSLTSTAKKKKLLSPQVPFSVKLVHFFLGPFMKST
jgi:hypothetical protein